MMREVKPQAIRRDERTRLLDVRAENLAQRPMQHVRGGVVPADPIPSNAVDRGRVPAASGKSPE